MLDLLRPLADAIISFEGCWWVWQCFSMFTLVEATFRGLSCRRLLAKERDWKSSRVLWWKLAGWLENEAPAWSEALSWRDLLRLFNSLDGLRMQHQYGVMLLVVKLYLIRWRWLVDGGLMMSRCHWFVRKRGVRDDDEDMMRSSRWTRKTSRWIKLRCSSETHKLRDVVEEFALKTGDL